MMVLKCDQRMQTKAMCKQMGILESEAEEFLRPMLQSDLVVMDGELGLTRTGEEVLAKLWFVVESAEAKILAGFTAEEARLLIKQLHRIQGNCARLMSSTS